jgi:DNA polymerase III delta prime subunit
MNQRDQFLWVEKYRPKTIDACILPKRLKQPFQDFIAQDEIPNMILAGSAGVGKTTVARALCEQLQCDYLLVNASEDSGIDILRNKIRNFASSVSLAGKTKVVILDEADYLNPNSTQPALRGAIEEFAKNCRFIMTCNFKNRIIQPLHSRCTVVEFGLSKEEKAEMAAAFFHATQKILKEEGVSFTKDILAKVVTRYFPDYRRILNELQRYSSSGTIDEGILIDLGEEAILALVKTLREKDFTEMRKWVAHNSDNDPNRLIRSLFDSMNKNVQPQSIPQLVLILGEYQYKVPFVADQELNLVAMCTEIMAAGIEFKGV